MRIHRTNLGRWETVVEWADLRCTTVTDQFGIAHELLVLAKHHRVVRILSGRSVEELGWLAELIGAQRGDEADPDEAT